MANGLEKKLMMDILTSLLALHGVATDKAIRASTEECIEVIHKHVCGGGDGE